MQFVVAYYYVTFSEFKIHSVRKTTTNLIQDTEVGSRTVMACGKTWTIIWDLRNLFLDSGLGKCTFLLENHEICPTMNMQIIRSSFMFYTGKNAFS
jgi:hypothetical protein